jgi:two-component system, NtrC family, response regulator HydG
MRVLIIDDDPDMCNLLTRFLQRKGFDTDSANSGHKGISKFKEYQYDIVLCDFRLGDREGNEVLKEIMAINPHTIFIIITGYSDIKTAVDVIKAGAFDYITKPLIPDEVLAVINKAISSRSGAGEESLVGKPVQRPKPPQHSNGSDTLVGQSGITKELYRQVGLVAPTNYSIILYGESGTGKEVIARTIHASSSRKDRPFIAMDCGTISKELAGSELFGHMKGSFTGAVNDKEGHFEMANGGTLFLDEVANLSAETQAALLRVLQERKIKRVGGNKEIMVDVRIIVASNENLQDSYRKGKFREDLFHRFNEFSISLPPLRHRKEDIPLFAEYFLVRANEELGKKVDGFEPEVLEAFLKYPWPGNLREFRNVVRRSALLTSSGKISMKVLPDEIVSSQMNIPTLETQQSGYQSEPRTLGLKDAAAQAEYEAIMKVLKQVNFNKSKAADILKIDRKTLYNKIKNYESEA